MHLIKNKKGNIVIYQSPSLKSCWGYIDDRGDYISERRSKKGQIFHFFQNAIAIQYELLVFLEKKSPNGNIKIYIPDFENEKFWAVVPIKDFRKYAMEWEAETSKPAIFSYDKKNFKPYGKQIRLPLNYWIREYKNQKKLI